MNNFWWLIFIFLWGCYGIAFGKKTGFFIGLFLSYICIFILTVWTVYDPVKLLPHIMANSLCLATAMAAFRHRSRKNNPNPRMNPDTPDDPNKKVSGVSG